MPIILATQEAEIRKIMAGSHPGEIVPETLSRKNLRRKGLVEWLKVQALSSNPSIEKKKRVYKDVVTSTHETLEYHATFTVRVTFLHSKMLSLEQLKNEI
jgi:plasmid maintenance system antidote protein VapI